MSGALRGRSFLGLADFSAGELESLLDLAADMKSGRDTGRHLEDRNLGMLFTVPSTRTRISFQVAARQLGGHAEYYTPEQLQMRNHESLVDTAAVMGRYLDGLIVRMYDLQAYGSGREGLCRIAEASGLPVINALDDKEHPCQLMADFLTLRERFGEEWRRRKVVLTWAFAERQKSPGVTHSMLVGAAKLGLDLTLAYPPGFEPDEEYVEVARRAARSSGARIEVSHDLDEASRGASAIYAKSWKSLSSSAEEDRALRMGLRDRWRVSRRHFERAAEGAVFMDCMPLLRGDEADAEVVDGPQSIRYDEAENRLHVQKAILARFIGDADGSAAAGSGR